MLIPLLLVSMCLVLMGGSRRDFVLWCPLAVSALSWCRVLEDRWVLPRHSVRASFGMNRWSARVCQPVRFSVIWLAALVSAVDKTRSSKSAEVKAYLGSLR